MNSELQARLARLGLIRAIGRVSSGSPVGLVLRPARELAGLRTIDATMALAKHGLTLLKAKRLIEAVVDDGEAAAILPTVESLATLTAELDAAGVKATVIDCSAVDVKAIRQRLGMTQELFALRYGLDLAALQNWEQGRQQPDTATSSYFRAIAARPVEIAEALEMVP
jgi:DNA-binding transcriptional regulator YiaG